MDFNLDIRTGVLTFIILMVIGMVFYILAGFREIRNSRNIPFYRKRHDGMVRGWRMLFLAVLLASVAFLANTYGEPLAYNFFPPSLTPPRAPTLPVTPSITLTPTVSPTSSESDTPTPTLTPHVPEAIVSQFEGVVTPNPDSIFSPLIFTEGIAEDYTPLNPNDIFNNPVGHMFGVFTYDRLTDGVQWTALWYRDGTLAYYETQVWNGGSGGIGYTDWNPPASDWDPGFYQVQIFLGRQLKVIGNFQIVGDPPTPTETTTPTPSDTPTITRTPTQTPWPTQTRTTTPTPSRTPTITRTPTPTRTKTPLPPTATNTLRPTFIPTATLTPSLTRQPTATPITPTPTITRWPTIPFQAPETPTPIFRFSPKSYTRQGSA